MLFDLRGRRRRAIQAIYLSLAILMGGGLVLFGIGSDVQGGLADIFGDSGDSNSGNSVIEKRIDRNQKRLATSPENTKLLAELVRDEYSLATSQSESNQAGFPAKARDELRRAGAYWQRYLKAERENPDPGLAAVAVQVYTAGALNKPKDAQKAAAIVAEEDNDPASYLRLVQFAALAGDTRTANLAAQKAVELAPKAERKAVKAQAELFKNPQAQQQPQG